MITPDIVRANIVVSWLRCHSEGSILLVFFSVCPSLRKAVGSIPAHLRPHKSISCILFTVTFAWLAQLRFHLLVGGGFSRPLSVHHVSCDCLINRHGGKYSFPVEGSPSEVSACARYSLLFPFY